MLTPIDALRSAVIQRLELVKLSELWGKQPWEVLGNAAYQEQTIAERTASVSVVVTLYNYADYIQQCLDSVCGSQIEGLPNGIEIVVVNDCSTDRSAQIVQDYLEKYPEIPICLVNKQFNTGLADARNLGLKVARSPYVFILDADNWIHPNCLVKLHEAVQESAAAFSLIRRFDSETQQEVGIMPDRGWDVQTLVYCPYIDAMAMFDRQVLLSVGGYSTELIYHGWFGWEDYDLWLKLADANQFCRFVPEVLCEYRVHSGSMINTTNLYKASIANYLRQKFQRLAAQYQENAPLLFGLPPQSEPSAQERLQQTQAQLKRVQAQLKQLQTQIKQTQSNAEQHTKQLQQRIQRDKLELQFRDLELQFTTAERDQYRGRLEAIESSKFWQLRSQWLLFKKQFLGSKESPFWRPDLPFPKPVRPELPAEILLSPPAPQKTPYERWQEQHEPRSADFKRMAEIVEILSYKPLISVIMPTYNTPEDFLRAAIESVLAQVYPHWELCIADDASPDPQVREILDGYAAQDRRIKVVFRSENGHISRSSNSALALATGEFVALLDHDDALRPEALYEVALLLNRYPDADMIYSDEDKIDEEGHRHDPFFKPEWCPDSFLTRMYTCHLGVYRRSLVDQIGGFQAGYEGSQDYDLVLRLTEATNRIYHIPKVLYHWRVHESSTASRSDAKLYAYDAAKKAISEALQRRGEPATVADVPDFLGFYHLRYQIQRPGKVTIVIPTRDLADILDQCLVSIFSKTTYPNYEVLVIDNGSVEPETHTLFQKWREQEPERFRCDRLDIPFNFSKINNYAAAQSTGDYLLFLNNDTEVITPDWLEAMVEQAQRPSIGAVGPFMLFPDRKVQHAGVVVGIGPFAGHAFVGSPEKSPGYFGQMLTTTNYSAVTGACLMCRREVFEAVGGFEESLAVALNDIDLCLKIQQQGYRNIFTPHAVLYHYESKSRGYEHESSEKQARYDRECEYAREKWRDLFENDPCYSPHLTRDHCDYRIRVD